MRRSLSSNGDLAPYGVQSVQYGSLRGVPGALTDLEGTNADLFGSTRGLHNVNKRPALANLDEKEERDWEVVPHPTDRLTDAGNIAWDSASVNDMSQSSEKKENLKRGGFFRRSIRDEPQNKDKWRDNVGKIDTTEEQKHSPKLFEEIKLQEVRKSSESLLSTKKKKRWFKWRKSSKSSTVPITPHLESPTESCESSQFPDRMMLGDKAASDVNLKMTGPPDDSRSLHEDLRRSQIPLKGYSQRTLAGMNLSNRLSSGTSQSVTSRSSLTGSDVLISDSSKSFMQYDLPRGKEQSSKCSNSSMADRIREGMTYEERVESSPGIASSGAISCQSAESLLEDYVRSGKRTVPTASQRKGIVFTESFSETPRDCSQAACIDDGGMTPIDGSCRVVPPEPLSPDSRPIRPLHCSTSVPVSSPTMIPHHVAHVSSSLPGHEAYPHSLMDRPISTRLVKRSSGAGLDHRVDDTETEQQTKKSNIAYTLTFQNEPITVNLRTKSQSVTPEPYLTPISFNGSPEYRNCKSEQILVESNVHSNDQLSGTTGFERQISESDDRETSPGYRLAYAKGPLRSPTPPRKSLRKNPKVCREKDKIVGTSIPKADDSKTMVVTPDTDILAHDAFTINNEDVVLPTHSKDGAEFSRHIPRGVEEVEFRSAQSSPIVLPDTIPRTQGSANNGISYTLEQFTNENDYVSQFSEMSVVNNDQEPNGEHIISQETELENYFEEKNGTKLQRRNTFTLPKEEKPRISKKSDEDKENILLDNTNSNGNHSSNDENQLISNPIVNAASFEAELCDRIVDVSSPSNDDILESKESLLMPKSSSSAAGGGSGSRIPVSRGGKTKTSSGSRIPTMLSSTPSPLATPERSSMRKKKGPGVSSSSIPSVGGVRKDSITKLLAPTSPMLDNITKLSAQTSPLVDNIIRTDDNAFLVKRETILQIGPEAISAVCSIM